MIAPVLVSLRLSITVTIILLAAGLPVSKWLVGSRSPVTAMVEAVLSVGMVLPPTVLGFYFLLVFSPYSPIGRVLEGVFGIRLVFSFAGLVIACCFASFPHMLSALKSGWKGVDRRTLEAAAVMGKSPVNRFFYVALPQLKTAVYSGVIICFAHTLGSFGLVLMVGGSVPGVTRVVSIAIYEEFEAGRMAGAHLYAGILLLVSCCAVWLLQAVQRRERRRG